MDVTAENLRLLIWQGQAGIPKGHQGITHLTSQQLGPAPAHGERDQTHFTSLRQSQDHLPGQGVPSHHLPMLDPPPPPRLLPYPTSAGSWVTADTCCILGFPMELAGPSRDLSPATVLPDASTPIHLPGRGEKGGLRQQLLEAQVLQP